MASSGRRPWAGRLTAPWAACSLALATVVVYWNSLSGPFVFDDIPSIPGNPTLAHLWPLSEPLSPPGAGLTVSGRPVLNFSFAVNTALGATAFGMRATNIAIHVAAGLLLLGVIRRTLTRPSLASAFGDAALPLAAAIAALWLLHPLQTESVSSAALTTRSATCARQCS